MRQIFQNLSTGSIDILEAPDPKFTNGKIILKSEVSLISVGTEKSLVKFGKSNLLRKAKSQPEKVKDVKNKVKTDGLLTTFEAVRNKLSQPLQMGYSNVGVVLHSQDPKFNIGDRVVSNAPHATIVSNPVNLCARIPENVSNEAASFTIVGSIGLQGVRLASPAIGEYYAVIGAGLIGLITIQILRANGCKVLAIDFDSKKLDIAKRYGAKTFQLGSQQSLHTVASAFSKGLGCDGVIITASTQSSDPISQAAMICRKRGKIILVGVTGLELNRSDFYEKELTFQVSCSYGPGRYDDSYEVKGIDYPVGFVRWTEQRNFQAILEMMSEGVINVDELITHEFLFEDAKSAYDMISERNDPLGVLLRYSKDNAQMKNTVTLSQNTAAPDDKPKIAFIGAGNYASRMLIPSFKKTECQLSKICANSGSSAALVGKKLGFKTACSDAEIIFNDSEINSVVITTRHNSHAELVVRALQAGKNVFVEKPLALTLAELNQIKSAYAKSNNILMVGFNRRFSPQIMKIKELIGPIGLPKVNLTMNAGLSLINWTLDPVLGGGRIIGEACHYIDLMRFLSGSQIVSVKAQRLSERNIGEKSCQNAIIVLAFEDGSMGSINYLANGHTSFPKERIEIFADGKVLQLDNFRRLRGYGWNHFKNYSLWRQDKGQNRCAQEFVKSIAKGGHAPISYDELIEVSAATIQANDLLKAMS